jgi:hypothetical protein
MEFFSLKYDKFGSFFHEKSMYKLKFGENSPIKESLVLGLDFGA